MSSAAFSDTVSWPSVAPVRARLFGDAARTPTIAYLLFLLVNATVFLRPGEMVPVLLGLPIYEGLIFSCLAFSLEVLRKECSGRSLYHNPITVCVIGLWLAIAFSHVTHGAASFLVESVILFFKTALYYALLVCNIDTPKRFRWFLFTTVLCAVAMVSLCVVDYLGIQDFTFVTHVTDRDGEDDIGNTNLVWRMRGTGIFEDPNDISLLIVAAGIMCICFMMESRSAIMACLWTLPLGILGTGLLCTRSRGGLLAGGAAFMTFILLRFGRGWTLLMGLLGMGLLPLIAGRQGNIDLEEGTGQERIQMWAEGFDALKSPDILFGIGQGLYADLAGLVAHNSYVHAYVELGLFGGTFFFGCFYFSALGLYRVTDPDQVCRDPEFRRLAPYLAAVLTGWAVGIFSLSRCYVVPTYMVLGLMSTYLALLGPRMQPACWVLVLNKVHVQRLVAASLGLFVFLYAFIKVFARFG